jgi:hypothetical protein
MKKKNTVIFGVFLLLSFIATFWWQYRRREAAVLPSINEVGNGPVVPVSTLVGASGKVPSSPLAAKPDRPSKGVLVATLLGTLNDKPIEFYGKVVDQAGSPLSGVAISASVLYNNGLTSGMSKSETKTDAQGRFSISGMRGRTLGLDLEKTGYEYDGEKGPFQFTELVDKKERYTPDQKNPVILTMWKLQGAESMLHFDEIDFKIQSDGAPMRINLITGKRVATGGDLIITLRHPKAEKDQEGLERYPWTAELVAAGGGFVESTAYLMYLAPESGYIEKLVLGETGKELKSYERGKYFVGGGGAYKKYYLKLGNGCYARVILNIGTSTVAGRDSYVGLEWWLNPQAGSRNLEFDPAKVIKPAK